jgi:hypothetical protein
MVGINQDSKLSLKNVGLDRANRPKNKPLRITRADQLVKLNFD